MTFLPEPAAALLGAAPAAQPAAEPHAHRLPERPGADLEPRASRRAEETRAEPITRHPAPGAAP